MTKNLYPNTISFFNHEISTKISLKNQFKIERKVMRSLVDNDPEQKYLNSEKQQENNLYYDVEDQYFFKANGTTLNGEYNFVLTCEDEPQLLCSRKKHHSYLANGKKILAAGSLVFTEGRVMEITNNSGHYTPTNEEMLPVINALHDASGKTLEYFVSYCTGSPVIYSVTELVENNNFNDTTPLPKRHTIAKPRQSHYDQDDSDENSQQHDDCSESRFGKSLNRKLEIKYQIMLDPDIQEQMKDLSNSRKNISLKN